MFNWRRFTTVVLICLMVLLGWIENATAHRRGGLPLVRPVPIPATPNQTPQVEKALGPLSLEPESYWQRLLCQEKAGEFEEAWKTGMALVNLFPQAPQRGATLLKLAELAKGKGETAQALELYGLAVCLIPDTPEAAQASLAAHVLELSRNLSQGDPIQALRHFLEKLAALPSGYAPETLQEALKIGWQAVCQKVRADASPPLTLVEDILALWDLQPQGVGPPEAAYFLADLLKEYGLWEEAQDLLAQEGKKTRDDRRSRLQVQNLELAWLSKGWPKIANFLKQVPDGDNKQKYLLRSWLTWWQAGFESSPIPDEALLAWFMSPKANAWWEGQLPGLEQNLEHPWAAPFAEHLQARLDQRFWANGHFSHSAQMQQPMADKPLRTDLSPFSRDRLGLSHLKSGKTDAAQETFRELAQHNDLFWRRLAQVRLTDLELSRLQAEPSP